MSMTIGVISDTHGLLRPEALKALNGSGLIVHAGDVGDLKVLETLKTVAPVKAVRGNCDIGVWASELSKTEAVEIEDILLYVIHDIKQLDIGPKAGGFNAVIYGHSHKPCAESRDGVLYLNPGSAGPRRFDLPVSVAKLYVDGKNIDFELITLI